MSILQEVIDEREKLVGRLALATFDGASETTRWGYIAKVEDMDPDSTLMYVGDESWIIPRSAEVTKAPGGYLTLAWFGGHVTIFPP